MRHIFTIQCKDETSGKTGCFISETYGTPFKAISPVFSDLLNLFKWMEENGWEMALYNEEGNGFLPTGCRKVKGYSPFEDSPEYHEKFA